MGSHADEVEGGEAVVRAHCATMAQAVHAELGRYRAAQEEERAELESLAVRGEAAEQRLQELMRVLPHPLRVSAGAIAVSAKTGDGFEELRRMIVDAAFDKQAFPTFGSKQPGTYSAIYEKLLRSHPEESSVTWEAMQESAGAQSELESSQLVVRFISSQLSSEAGDAEEDRDVAEPEPEEDQGTVSAEQLRIVGTLQCEVGGLRTKFEDKRVELSRAGMLTVEGRAPADLTKLGTKVGQPKKPPSGRPFCVRIDCVDPTCKYLLDTSNVEQQRAWLLALQAVADRSAAQSNVRRDYTFVVAARDEELKTVTIDHRGAKAVHQEMQAAGLVSELQFPGSKFDLKDFTYTEANWSQRAKALEGYFQQMFHDQDAVSHRVFKQNFGFDFADLAEKYGRVSTKVRKDPQLLRRAMTFLGLTGEIIDPGYASEPALADRVFLRPNWLVNVMKELVRHDLRDRLQAIDAATVRNADQIRSLGETFVSTGILDRALRPWLWRDLQPCIVHDEAQMDFLCSLMEHFGLLVSVPGSDPPQWMLPMRLPRRNVVLAAATAQNAFAAFLSEIESRAAEAGPQACDLVSATTPMVHAQIMSGEQATHDCLP